MLNNLLENFINASFILVALMGIQLANIVMGSREAIISKTFEWSIFFKGVLKAIMFVVSIAFALVAIEAFGLGIERFGYQIPEGTISTLEIVGVLAAAFIKYGKDFISKLQEATGVTDEEKLDLVAKEAATEQQKG